ncbi:MAG TPA: type II toxin-antitoxin system PemK/MazF family toxin [Nocardioides sp.]
MTPTTDLAPLRGQIFRVDLGHGPQPWVVVSNNARNRNLETSIAARITTTGRHARLPTVVALGPADPLVGFVVVDDLVQFYRDELTKPLGALAPMTMAQISEALRIALP